MEDKELAEAACAHAVRGAGGALGIGVGGSSGGGLDTATRISSIDVGSRDAKSDQLHDA